MVCSAECCRADHRLQAPVRITGPARLPSAWYVAVGRAHARGFQSVRHRPGCCSTLSDFALQTRFKACAVWEHAIRRTHCSSVLRGLSVYPAHDARSLASRTVPGVCCCAPSFDAMESARSFRRPFPHRMTSSLSLDSDLINWRIYHCSVVPRHPAGRGIGLIRKVPRVRGYGRSRA